MIQEKLGPFVASTAMYPGPGPMASARNQTAYRRSAGWTSTLGVWDPPLVIGSMSRGSPGPGRPDPCP